MQQLLEYAPPDEKQLQSAMSAAPQDVEADATPLAAAQCVAKHPPARRPCGRP